MKADPHGLQPKIWPLLICLLGFGLLVFRLNAASLWADEARTAEWVQRVDQGGPTSLLVQSGGHPLSHPPLYFLSLWMWTSLTGDGEFTLRFPSVFFGILGVAMVYPLGTRMVNRRVALMTMGLMSISPFLVMYSRIARPYSTALFFALLSCWFFTELLVGPTSRRKWLCYIASSTVLMYTEYLVAFILAAQTVVALAGIRHNRRFVVKFLTAQLAVMLFFVPWIPFTMRLSGQVHSGQVALSGSNVMHWLLSVVHPLFAWTVGETIYPWNPAAVVGVILGLGLAGRGLFSGAKAARDEETEAASEEASDPGVGDSRLGSAQSRIGSAWGSLHMALPVFIVLPLSLTILINRFLLSEKTFMDVANKAIVCAPFLYLLLARGIWTIGGWGRRLLVVAVLGIVLGVSLTNYYLGRELHNPNQALPARAMTHEIVHQAEPDDIFVSDSTVGFDYYISKEDPEAVHFFAHDPQTAMNYVQEHQRPGVWLILLCRAVDTESLATTRLVPWLLNEGYSLELSYSYAPLDGAYRRLQELVLRKPACEHKVIVQRYAPLWREW